MTPKTTGPATGQVASTMVAAALHFQDKATTNRDAPTIKRGRKRLIVLGSLVVVMLLVAVIFRNSAVVERFTGKGYDSNPLPTHAVALPEFAGAEYTLTTQSIAVTGGLPTNFWRTERDLVNYTTRVAKVTVDHAQASVIGGAIGTPQTTSAPTTKVVDVQSSYMAGATQADPWTRQQHDPGSSTLAVLSPHEVLMYQDVIDLPLRSQHPTTVVSETRHDVAVTTYSYALTFGKFYESAPRLFDMVKMMDGVAAADAPVTVTISLDDHWMVRYLDVDIDFHAVLKYKAERDIDMGYPYRYTVDVVSVTTSPPEVALPTNVVEPPTTTIPAPAVAP